MAGRILGLRRRLAAVRMARQQAAGSAKCSKGWRRVRVACSKQWGCQLCGGPELQPRGCAHDSHHMTWNPSCQAADRHAKLSSQQLCTGASQSKVPKARWLLYVVRQLPAASAISLQAVR